MTAEPETRRASWLAYATIFAVVLPVLYVLSSGPAQCIARTESGSTTLSFISGPNTAAGYIPFCQRSIDSRWTPALARIYKPLTWFEQHTIASIPLDWYWRVFGDHKKNIFYSDLGLVSAAD